MYNVYKMVMVVAVVFFPRLLFVDLAPEEKRCGLYCQQKLPTEKNSLVFYLLAG